MSTDDKVAVGGYYTARAAEYDDIYRKPERQSDLRRIEEWLPPQLSNRKVLEIACGTGYWTQFIAPVARHLVEFDTSVEVINIAKTRVPAGKVSFRIADACERARTVSVAIGAVRRNRIAVRAAALAEPVR